MQHRGKIATKGGVGTMRLESDVMAWQERSIARRRCMAVDEDELLEVTVVEAEDSGARGQWSGVGRWSRTSSASMWLVVRW